MENKVLINEKDLRLVYKRDGGSINIENDIRLLSLDNDKQIYNVIDYLQYLETKLAEKYNEIDEFLSCEEDHTESEEKYIMIQDAYNKLVDNCNEINKERIDVIFKKIKLIEQNVKLQSKLDKLELENAYLVIQLKESEKLLRS